MRVMGFHLGLQLILLIGVISTATGESVITYADLLGGFENPDHARYGEVPLWWWEGQPMTRERVTAELEELASQGVKAVCPIQRSPGRCDPASFTPEWWDLLAYVNAECARLGMTLWAYDQVGYGNYGWLEKAAAEVQDPETHRVVLAQAEGTPEAPIELTLPEGLCLGIRAYPLVDGVADDGERLALDPPASGNTLSWTPPSGTWRVVAMVAAPMPGFYLSAASADQFIARLYGKIEETLGADSMGTSFVGVFQDEHPPTPRDRYTAVLATEFQSRWGYPMTRAIPALYFDVGAMTPKYRSDYFDTYLDVVEQDYWKRVYDWTEARGLLTSHDNWGRNNLYRQSEGYIDYFRTQRWFSAPGYDDAGRHPLQRRNYYDTKIAASIARLYNRPRVWNEAFHTSGWGRTTEETLSWLSTGMAFGANLYDEHGLYYAINASTWEHAAPDPHWRQPYWRYYHVISDFVARSSFVLSQGQHVVDAGVHYPVVSLLAGEPPGQEGPDYNGYMGLSRKLYDEGIDNDIIDDDSILNGMVRDGQLYAGGNGYRAITFGPETTVRRAVLAKMLALVESGGTVLFFGKLPEATTEGGREDAELEALLRSLLGEGFSRALPCNREFSGGGYCAFLPTGLQLLPALVTEHVARDYVPMDDNCYVTHRRVADADVYLVQNASRRSDTVLEASFRVKGVPEVWDPLTGERRAVDWYEESGEYTRVRHLLQGHVAKFFVFQPGEVDQDLAKVTGDAEGRMIPISEEWEFSTIATRDNRWGEFHWPPSDTLIGPEVRTLRFAWGQGSAGGAEKELPKGLDALTWEEALYSMGPYWLVLSPGDSFDAVDESVLSGLQDVAPGSEGHGSRWAPVAFSKKIGLAKAAPWGGHSGYPDGHIDKNFIELPEGRKLLFTRINSPSEKRVGLRVELHNSGARLWVNGEEQPFEDAVGNLPLEAGVNTVLLDLPDGDHGRLYPQEEPPSVRTLAEAQRGMVQPALEEASWIWEGSTQATHVRKAFELDSEPVQARVIVSGYSGYQLYVNGRMVGEEIGPWSNWRKPESFTITEDLRKGQNVIAIWGQLFAGQNVNKGEEAFNSRGVVAALQVRFDDESEWGLVTDGSWRGSVQSANGWETAAFSDDAWAPVMVQGKMGDAPWGREVLDNAGLVTETRRPLSVNLDSPYLTCFDALPELSHDVLPADHSRVGWYQFDAPPGLGSFTLPTEAKVRAWVNGEEVAVREGKAEVGDPPADVSEVTLRLEMTPGSYGGAAFDAPLALTLGGGRMAPGLWKDYALPTYAGIGVYRQDVVLSEADVRGGLVLELGKVLVAAEVLVNGQPVGVRLAAPFTFDLGDAVQVGENTLEVRVANTLAPHFETIPSLAQGPTASGLIGPVTLTSVGE